jgi:hypothetical protein
MRLTLYFIFSGLGSGAVVAAYLLSLAGGISRGDLILPDLTGGAVLAIGIALVWAPVGPRVRQVRLLLRPTRSWTFYETYAAGAFFVALAILAKVPLPTVELSVALCAFTVMICQAQIARSSKSRPAWRADEIPSLIVIMGLTTGVGLIALLSAIIPYIIRGGTLASVAGMTLAVMGAYRWREYARNVDTALRGEIASLSRMLYTVPYGVPFILYLAALVPWPLAGWLLPIAGVAALIGGTIWTHTVIARLGHRRDFIASPIGL